jgi:hypothetical protein
MIIIETFERGSMPRHRPTGPMIAIRIEHRGEKFGAARLSDSFAFRHCMITHFVHASN